MRRLSDDSPEPATEVRLITHTAAQSDCTQRVAGGEHQTMSYFYPSAREVIVRRDTHGGFECPAEVADTEAEQRRQMFDSNCFGQVGIDVRRQALDLPRREPSAGD